MCCLVRFDESIDAFCGAKQSAAQRWRYAATHAGTCVNANLNILSLYAGPQHPNGRVPYNLCRNLEWQVHTLGARG